jgi:uncharacterized DUF497 family protein
MFIYWNAWNIEHIAKHGVSLDEAESVVAHARPPYPEQVGDGKYAVWGATEDGRYLQVIYTFWSVEQVDLADVPPHRRDELAGLDEVHYVIHARDLTNHEKRRYRRRSS